MAPTATAPKSSPVGDFGNVIEMPANRHAPCFVDRSTFQAPHLAKECAMLVLKRKMQEQIKIGDNIVITVVRIRGRAVSIGIDAPSGVRVLRAELPNHPPVPADVQDSDATDADPDDPVQKPDTLRQPLTDHLRARRCRCAGMNAPLLARSLLTSPTLGMAAGFTS
jgi:carbon storage regulator CsrA